MSRMKLSNPGVALIANTWAHFAFGEPLMAPVAGYQITRQQFDAALTKFEPIDDALAYAGYAHDQAWIYLGDVAPWAVQIVGSGWSPGVYVDTTGSGA